MSSVRRFQQALMSADAQAEFHNVPVDWWDGDARRWRPSVVENVDHSARPRTHVEIVAPSGSSWGSSEAGYTAISVPIVELRPSKLVNEPIAQFFTTRYTLGLIESLMPCIDRASDTERESMQSILDQLLETYASSYAVWHQAFSQGSRDGDESITGVWLAYALEPDELPRRGERDGEWEDIFTAVRASAVGGSLDCAPVARWDEDERCWRPTLILGATGDADQFLPRSEVAVLEPGRPIRVVRVSGAVLSPLDLTNTSFSLVALPVMARDTRRMYEALRSAGFSRGEIAVHPLMIALVKMMDGAAAEWAGFYADGLEGPPPEPRVAPLAPALWGLVSGRVEDSDLMPDELADC